MMRCFFRFMMKGLLLLFCVLLYNCRGYTPPVTYYTLSPISLSDASESTDKKLQSIALGVGPITLPEYLDRAQIVTRSGPNRLSIAEFHRWGGSLDEDILRVLAENLSVLLNSYRVFVYPWDREFRPDFSISFVINAFEAQPDNKVQLKVNWTLTDNTDGSKPVHMTSKIEADASSSDFEAIAAAKSRILADLSKEIVKEIYKLSK